MNYQERYSYINFTNEITHLINNRSYFKVSNKLKPILKKMWKKQDLNDNEKEVMSTLPKLSKQCNYYTKYIKKKADKAIDYIKRNNMQSMRGGNINPIDFRKTKNLFDYTLKKGLVYESRDFKLDDIKNYTTLQALTTRVKTLKNTIKQIYDDEIATAESNDKIILSIMKASDVAQVHTNYIRAILLAAAKMPNLRNVHPDYFKQYVIHETTAKVPAIPQFDTIEIDQDKLMESVKIAAQSANVPQLKKMLADLQQKVKVTETTIKKNIEVSTKALSIALTNNQILLNQFDQPQMINLATIKGNLTNSNTVRQQGGNNLNFQTKFDVYNDLIFTKNGVDFNRNKITRYKINHKYLGGALNTTVVPPKPKINDKNKEITNLKKQIIDEGVKLSYGLLEKLAKSKTIATKVNRYNEYFEHWSYWFVEWIGSNQPAKNIRQHYQQVGNPPKKSTKPVKSSSVKPSNIDIKTLQENISIGEIDYYNDILKDIIKKWELMGFKAFSLEKNDPFYYKNTFANKSSEISDFFKNQKYIDLLTMPTDFDIDRFGSKIIEYVPHIKNNDYRSNLLEYKEMLYVYFYKYYIPIMKFNYIFNRIKDWVLDTSVPNINLDSMLVYGDRGNDINVFISMFHKFTKDVLQPYIVATRKPVTVYVRVNDIDRIGNDFGQAKAGCQIMNKYFTEVKKLIAYLIKEKAGDKNIKLLRKPCLNIKAITSQKNWRLPPSKTYIAGFYKNPLDTPEFKNLAKPEHKNCQFCNKFIGKSDETMWRSNPQNDKELVVHTPSDYCPKYKNYENKGSIVTAPVRFSNVFYSNMFKDNKTISKYMLLDKTISSGIGTLLITYGYSGVGKSYTLFGDSSKGVDGLLQATIRNVGSLNKPTIKLRIYEIYGLGPNYADLWNDYNKIDQRVITYTIQSSPQLKGFPNELLCCEKINPFIDDINKGKEKFENITVQNLDEFDKFVSDVEHERRQIYEGIAPRIRGTLNNPNSSRSKIIYDFSFEFTDKSKNSTLVIDDSPGAENPIETYIENILNDNAYYTFCDTSDVRNCAEIKKWQQAMLYAILINPLYLSILCPDAVFFAIKILNKKQMLGPILTNKLQQYFGTKGTARTKYNDNSNMYLTYLMGCSYGKFLKQNTYENNPYGHSFGEDKMKDASNIIMEIINYCKNKTGSGIKYSILIEFLTEILFHTNILFRSRGKRGTLKNKYGKIFYILFSAGTTRDPYEMIINNQKEDPKTTYMQMVVFYDQLNSNDVKLRDRVKGHITLAMEANYINQNILGIMDSTANRSGVKNIKTISRDVAGMTTAETIERINLLINEKKYNEYDEIIKQIKEHNKIDVLFKTKKDNENTTIVAEILNPYIKPQPIETTASGDTDPYINSAGGKKKQSLIQDFKMFYVLQNNKTEMKCLEQMKLYSRLHGFIDSLKL
jgi:hypothetical protein